MLHTTGNLISYCTRFIAQIFIFWISKLLVIRGRHTNTSISFNRHAPTILVANHAHALDPFAIVSSFRFRDFLSLAPFAFMTAPYFYRPLWLRPLCWLAGCFPAKVIPGSRAPHGIEGAIHLVRRGYTLFIFPEGTRITGERLPAKRGVSVIVEHTDRPRIVLARIEWRRRFVTRIARRDLGRQSQVDAQRLVDDIYEL